MQSIHLADFHPEMNLFDALSPEAFRKLLGIARRETVEAGSALLREGGDADTLSVILAGKVKVFKDGDDGQPMEIAVLGSGSIFGEMGVFDGQPASATILAAEDSSVLLIPRARLFEFLKANPDIAFSMMHAMIYILSARLRKANVHASSISSSNPLLGQALNDLLGD
jgi:CRP/FNR family cyclic AMP-dependent transcriptional regulator